MRVFHIQKSPLAGVESPVAIITCPAGAEQGAGKRAHHF